MEVRHEKEFHLAATREQNSVPGRISSRRARLTTFFGHPRLLRSVEAASSGQADLSLRSDVRGLPMSY